MPQAQRRRGTGPEVSTGRGIGASSDRRTNVRWSELELAAVEAGARAAGQPSVAAYVRDVTLQACGYVAPAEGPATGPVPWVVDDEGGGGGAPPPEVLGDATPATAQVSLDAGRTFGPVTELRARAPARTTSKKRKPSPSTSKVDDHFDPHSPSSRDLARQWRRLIGKAITKIFG